MIVLGFSGIENGDYYREQYGLRFVGHDAAVALVVDGEVLFAAEEERFTRKKHTSHFPVRALDAALNSTGIELGQVDRLAYTWKVTPWRALSMCRNHALRVPLGHRMALAATGVRVIRDLMLPGLQRKRLARVLGTELPPCEGVAHHMGHSTTAYLSSPFEQSAVLTIDGQGENESASLGEWQGLDHRPIRSCLPAPRSAPPWRALHHRAHRDGVQARLLRRLPGRSPRASRTPAVARAGTGAL